jgi:hypothetical protein
MHATAKGMYARASLADVVRGLRGEDRTITISEVGADAAEKPLQASCKRILKVAFRRSSLGFIPDERIEYEHRIVRKFEVSLANSAMAPVSQSRKILGQTGHFYNFTDVVVAYCRYFVLGYP